jgi:hypothetical protein
MYIIFEEGAYGSWGTMTEHGATGGGGERERERESERRKKRPSLIKRFDSNRLRLSFAAASRVQSER